MADDKRQKKREEIQESILRLAASYTPEWRPKTEKTDTGMVLAQLFQEALLDTWEIWNQLGEENRRHFEKLSGFTQCGEKPATGYAVFSMAGEDVPGVRVEKGHPLLADAQGEKVFLKTEQEVLAAAAVLTDCCQTDAEKDIIVRENHEGMFSLFQTTGKENLQKHNLYMGFESLLEVQGEAALRLLFENLFLDSQDAGKSLSFSYYSQEGWQTLKAVWETGDVVSLHKTASQPCPQRTEIMEKEGFYLRCECSRAEPDRAYRCRKVCMELAAGQVLPDVLWGGGMEYEPGVCRPFGTSLYLFQELCLGSNEVFTKRGGRICLDFDLEFEVFPVAVLEAGPLRQPRWLIRDTEFYPEKRAAVYAMEAVWEYYNGMGWKRLFSDGRYGDVFDAGKGNQGGHVQMVFDCPQDIRPLYLSSQISRFIRVRISRIANEGNIRGDYQIPVLRDIHFSYDTKGTELYPDWMLLENQLERKIVPGRYQGPLFYQRLGGGRELYLGFSRPLEGEPVRLFFQLEEERTAPGEKLVWEYLQADGFHSLMMEDDTRGLTRTGLVTLWGNTDFAGAGLFGRRAYWIRVRREGVPGGPVRLRCFTNGVRVSGDQRNLPAGTQLKLGKTAGFIRRAWLPSGLWGGRGQETLESARKRSGGLILRHRRWVTSEDLDALIREAVRDVERVWCFSGRDESGRPAAGTVTAVLLLGDKARRGKGITGIREEIFDYLGRRNQGYLLEMGKLRLREPDFIPVSVSAKLISSPDIGFFQMMDEAKRLLEKQLDSLSGNGGQKGWNIGEFPSEAQIRRCLESLPDIQEISELRLSWEIPKAAAYPIPKGGIHMLRGQGRER